MTQTEDRQAGRSVQWAVLVACLAWALLVGVLAGRAASGIAVRFGWGVEQGLLEAAFRLFLLVVGFRGLQGIATRGRGEDEVLALPVRAGWAGEWGTGLAVGWGMCLVAVLPVAVSGHLHAHWVGRMAGLRVTGVAVATVLVNALALEVLFRGYPYRRLREAVGMTPAAVGMTVLFALTVAMPGGPGHPVVALLNTAVLGLLLTMGYERTRALWVGWGLHLGYRVVMAVVLGLPVAGTGMFGAVLETDAGGPWWLAGGGFGLDGAVWTLAAMLVAMGVLWRTTREYAWRYTAPVLVGAGYEVAVAPPAAHVAMEQKAVAAPPALVQILPVTPRGGEVPRPE